jgi:hypothetical protein
VGFRTLGGRPILRQPRGKGAADVALDRTKEKGSPLEKAFASTMAEASGQVTP